MFVNFVRIYEVLYTELPVFASARNLNKPVMRSPMWQKSVTFAPMKRFDPHSLWRPVVWVCRFRYRRGYGVHSPFAFQLITRVFYERGEFYAYRPLAALRRTETCGQSERLDRLILRLVNDVQPSHVALWGDMVDMTRHYVVAGCRRARIDEIGCGDLPDGKHYDMLFARRPEAVQSLFETFAAQAPDQAVAVFEGIHRSRRRMAQWKAACRHPRATVTFDLYDLGIIFLHPKLNPQHYLVNF